MKPLVPSRVLSSVEKVARSADEGPSWPPLKLTPQLRPCILRQASCRGFPLVHVLVPLVHRAARMNVDPGAIDVLGGVEVGGVVGRPSKALSGTKYSDVGERLLRRFRLPPTGGTFGAAKRAHTRWDLVVTLGVAFPGYSSPSKPMRSIIWPSVEAMKSSSFIASSLCSTWWRARSRAFLETSTARNSPAGADGTGSASECPRRMRLPHLAAVDVDDPSTSRRSRRPCRCRTRPSRRTSVTYSLS